jgi:hypothetical protein
MLLHVRVVSPAALAGQVAAAPEVTTGSGFGHCGGIAIEGGPG